MPYVGSPVQQSFQAIPSVQRMNGTGSQTAYTLDRNVGNVQDVLISVDGVVQDSNAYSITGGTNLVFSEAPSSGTGNIFVNFLGVTDGSVVPPEANKGNFKSGGLFRTNAQTLEEDITITATENATVAGTLTINSNITLTINDGGRLVLV